MRVSISLSLDNDKDRDLLRWLDGFPKRERSKAIRDALRTYLGRGGITLTDVYQAVRELDRKVQAGAFVAHIPDDDMPDEPPDVAAALDKLGL